jgi:hypothetical protein
MVGRAKNQKYCGFCIERISCAMKFPPAFTTLYSKTAGSVVARGVLFGVIALISPMQAQTTGPFVNFEAQHTRPVCLSPDGTRLFVLNTPDARLSVFDVSNPANPMPVLIREIRTGLEPVAVNAVSNEEAWVVNEVSDSVSVVSVSAGITPWPPCPARTSLAMSFLRAARHLSVAPATTGCAFSI